MWLSLARRGTVLFAPRIAQRYRRHGGPSGNKSAMTLRNYLYARHIFQKHIRHVPLPRRARLRREIRAYWRRGYAPRLLRDADKATNSGDWAAARKLWRALVDLDPGLLLRNRHIRINYAWSLLPTDRPPFWRRRGVKKPSPVQPAPPAGIDRGAQEPSRP